MGGISADAARDSTVWSSPAARCLVELVPVGLGGDRRRSRIGHQLVQVHGPHVRAPVMGRLRDVGRELDQPNLTPAPTTVTRTATTADVDKTCTTRRA